MSDPEHLRFSNSSSHQNPVVFGNLSDVILENPQDMERYITVLGRVIQIAYTLEAGLKQKMLSGAVEDILKRAEQGVVFPFTHPQFLKMLKMILMSVPAVLVHRLIEIMPDALQKAMKGKAHTPSPIKNNTHTKPSEKPVTPPQTSVQEQPQTQAFQISSISPPFLREIIEKFSIRSLLPLFGYTLTDNEDKDRDIIAPVFLVLGEALGDFNPETKRMSDKGTFSIICKLRGFVMMYYRKGANFNDALGLYQKLYPEVFGILASSAAKVNLGDFICGVKCLMDMTSHKPPAGFLEAIFYCADAEAAYTMPRSLLPISLPYALPYPVPTIPTGIFRHNMPVQERDKFEIYNIPMGQNYIIDTGDGELGE